MNEAFGGIVLFPSFGQKLEILVRRKFEEEQVFLLGNGEIHEVLFVLFLKYQLITQGGAAGEAMSEHSERPQVLILPTIVHILVVFAESQIVAGFESGKINVVGLEVLHKASGVFVVVQIDQDSQESLIVAESELFDVVRGDLPSIDHLFQERVQNGSEFLSKGVLPDNHFVGIRLEEIVLQQILEASDPLELRLGNQVSATELPFDILSLPLVQKVDFLSESPPRFIKWLG